MLLNESQKQQLIQIWALDGMPENLARRQFTRIEEGRQMTETLANRLGGVRTEIDNENWWLLFDAAQEALTWDALPEDWKTQVREAEDRLRQICQNANRATVARIESESAEN